MESGGEEEATDDCQHSRVEVNVASRSKSTRGRIKSTSGTRGSGGKRRKRGGTSFYRTKKGRGKGRKSGDCSSATTPGDDDVGQQADGEEIDNCTVNISVDSEDLTYPGGSLNRLSFGEESQDVGQESERRSCSAQTYHTYYLPRSASDAACQTESSNLAISTEIGDEACPTRPESNSNEGVNKANLLECFEENHDTIASEGCLPEGGSVSRVEECLDSVPEERALHMEESDVNLENKPPPIEQHLIDEVLEVLRGRLPQPWICLPEENGANVMLVSRVQEKAIQRRIYFPYQEGCEVLTVHRKPVPESLSKKVFEGALHEKVFLLEETKSKFIDRVLSVVDKVRSFDICMGVYAKDFKVFWDLEVLGEVDKNWYGEVRYQETFRPNNCELLVSTMPSTIKRCHECLRKKRNFASRIQEKDTEKNPHTRNTYLSREELLQKVEQKQRNLENARARIVRLKAALKTAIDEEGSVVSEDDSKHLCDLLEKEKLSPGQELFIHEQIKIARAAKPCGRTWHPTILRFALLLKSTSTAAFRAVADSGMIVLPSERTLFEYSHAVDAKEGCTKEKLTRICKQLKEKYPETYQKYHVLLMDEMHVNKKLVYQKSSGEMIGYVKMTDAQRELLNLESELKGETHSEPAIASKILTLMVNGLGSGVCEVVATFPTLDNLDADVLYDKVWDTIGALERSGIWIIAVVGDGASINRAFFACHPPLTKGFNVTFDTVNLAAPHRPLFFLSDVPHLLKTIRNCMYKSGSGPKCTRLLTINNEVIVWSTIVKLYNADKKNNIRRCFKLNLNNVRLNPFSVMKVSLAAQVLSNTVALDLKSRNWPGTKETVTFIQNVNDWFDMLNGKGYSDDERKANPNLALYTDQNDERFDKLLAFLDYLKGWKAQVDAKQGYEPKEKAKMMLSYQTLEGIEMTVRSFIALTKYLLGEGVKFVRARDLIQDDLERYFSKQRQMGGGIRNPTVAQFLSNERKIAVHKDLNVRASNVQGKKRPLQIDESKLEKRKKL